MITLFSILSSSMESSLESQPVHLQLSCALSRFSAESGESGDKERLRWASP